MAGGYVNLPDDPLEDLRRRLQDAQRRLDELERPSGSQIYDTLATLTDLVNNLAAEIEAVSASGATWQGPVSSGSGNIQASSGDIVTSSGDFYTPHGRATPVVSSYVAAYINVDGRIGATPSARRFKRDIRPAGYSMEQIEKIQLVSYRLREAVKEIGPDAAWEVGVIAEQLLDAGLPEFVICDEKGEPFSVAYDRLALLGLAGVQSLGERVSRIESLIES